MKSTSCVRRLFRNSLFRFAGMAALLLVASAGPAKADPSNDSDSYEYYDYDYYESGDLTVYTFADDTDTGAWYLEGLGGDTVDDPWISWSDYLADTDFTYYYDTRLDGCFRFNNLGNDSWYTYDDGTDWDPGSMGPFYQDVDQFIIGGQNWTYLTYNGTIYAYDGVSHLWFEDSGAPIGYDGEYDEIWSTSSNPLTDSSADIQFTIDGTDYDYTYSNEWFVGNGTLNTYYDVPIEVWASSSNPMAGWTTPFTINGNDYAEDTSTTVWYSSNDGITWSDYSGDPRVDWTTQFTIQGNYYAEDTGLSPAVWYSSTDGVTWSVDTSGDPRANWYYSTTDSGNFAYDTVTTISYSGSDNNWTVDGSPPLDCFYYGINEDDVAARFYPLTSETDTYVDDAWVVEDAPFEPLTDVSTGESWTYTDEPFIYYYYPGEGTVCYNYAHDPDTGEWYLYDGGAMGYGDYWQSWSNPTGENDDYIYAYNDEFGAIVRYDNITGYSSYDLVDYPVDDWTDPSHYQPWASGSSDDYSPIAHNIGNIIGGDNWTYCTVDETNYAYDGIIDAWYVDSGDTDGEAGTEIWLPSTNPY